MRNAGQSSPRPSYLTWSGATTSTAPPMWWRPTSGTCGARSGRTESRPYDALVTGWSIGEVIAAGADRRHRPERHGADHAAGSGAYPATDPGGVPPGAGPLLRQEMTEVRLGLPAELEAARGADGVADAAEVELAIQRYLAHNPGSIRHLTVIQVGSNVFSTRDGPPDLEQLRGEWAACRGRRNTHHRRLLGRAVAHAHHLVGQRRLPFGTLIVVGPLAQARPRPRRRSAG